MANPDDSHALKQQYKKYIFLTLKSSFPIASVMCATKGLLRRSNCSKKGKNGMK